MVLHERNGGISYQESVTIGEQKKVVIMAAEGEKPVIQGVGNMPGMDMGGSSQVFLRGLKVTNGGGVGIRLGVTETYIQRSEVVNNTGGGIVLEGGGNLVLENSFVGGNVNDVPAVSVVSGGLVINYSTLATGFGNAPALFCSDGTGKSVRNSILVSRSNEAELDCSNVTITGSALEMAMGENLVLGEVDIMWFEGYANGNFHLVPGMYPEELESAAIWQDGDPLVDIDGEARQAMAGATDFAGADVVP
ncbi:MAG: hypothetical protein HC927_06000 [Deltaproteobacteria bacterium]|nr:hypothetical protein [Deltaproteobacteria bacterium]